MGLTKLKINAYEKPGDSSIKKTYTALINPDSFQVQHTISYNEQQAPGTTTPQLKFKCIPSKKITFKLIFDGTGLVSTASQAQLQKTVPQQLDDFKDTTIKYEGDIHEPYFLELVWGTSIFEGYITSLSVSYKLFKPDGTPIRAEADVTFSTSNSASDANKSADPKSPDLTHIRQIKSGDRLPNMCNDIYKDTNTYIQVARYNQVNHIRSLRIGRKLSFPPLVSQP
ncbi:MAG: LysM peptidoglycan-binding domain-containing protein [Bacteroidota bacterium]